MKLALDVWYEAWSRTEGDDAGGGDRGEAVAAEVRREVVRRDGGCRHRMDAGRDLGQPIYLGL